MKKLKKAVTLISISFLINTVLQANDNSKITSETILHLEKFYYQKGFRDAGEKYYKKGYLQAIKDIKKRLALFKKKHEAIESSKYLSLTGKITYPEVFKIRDGNGEYKIKIIPPHIEKTFTVYDLVNLPDGTDIDNKINKTLKNDKIEQNSFYGQGELSNAQNKGQIINANNINKKIIMDIAKTAQNKAALNIGGIAYTEGKDSYRAYFKDRLEKRIFCNGVGEQICK